MSPALVVLDGEGERRFTADRLPLRLGGIDGDIVVSGYADPEPLAVVGFEREDLFIEPVDTRGTVICNGAPVAASLWLHSGDRLRLGKSEISVAAIDGGYRLEVTHRVAEPKTDPPLVRSPPSSELEPGQTEARVAPVQFTPAAARAEVKRKMRLSPSRLLWALGLLLLGAIAWFLFTARAVEIVSEPPADEVTIEGTRLRIELGGRHLMRPGDYRVRITKEGYLPLEAPLSVSREASQSYRFELEKTPGLLVIEAQPRVGAEVRVDGESVGETPVDPLPLAEGEHTIEILHPRYVPYASTVNVEGAGTTLELTVELTPNWATIEFDSRPPGATIRIDGEEIGTTPVVADVVAGSRRVEVRRDGYKPYRSELLVQANVPRRLPPIVLQPSDGVLIVESDPAEATVSIDGDYAGLTPLDLELQPNRSYEVAVAKLGFESSTSSVEIQTGKTRNLRVELQPRLGEIEIDGRPADAELLVDGEPKGRASQTLQLLAVPHEIVVQKEGFETFRQTITPRPGYPQQIQVTLRTPEEIRRAETPARLTNSLGMELVLVGPGSFLMGASRREPGRRANETLRQVQLTRAFYIGAREISNREFRQYREGHRSGRAESPTLERDDHPVVDVSWEDAAGFCNWLSERESLPKAYVQEGGTLVLAQPMNTGYRLPTEAEWAWAARFAGRDRELKFPWGDSLPVPPGAGNYADESAAGLLQKTLSGYRDSYPSTAPVDSFDENAVGIKNLGGNVAEWVDDFYSIPPPTSGTPEVDPKGPAEGEYRVIRGSSWMHSTITELRLSYRDYGNKGRPDVGFRVARFAE